MKKMNSKLLGTLCAALLAFAVASPAMAGGSNSYVNGNVAAGASVKYGVGGFDVGFTGGAGTLGWGGFTAVSAGGGTQGFVAGGHGVTDGAAVAGATAQQGHYGTVVDAGALSGSSVSVWDGFGSSNAGANGTGSAVSWW